MKYLQDNNLKGIISFYDPDDYSKGFTVTIIGGEFDGQQFYDFTELLPEVEIQSGGGDGSGVNFNNIGIVLTLGGNLYNDLGNAIANKNGWVDAKGNYKSTDLLKKQANGKYVRGVQGYRNGYNSALKVAGKYKTAGNIVGGLGITVTGIQYYNNQITGTEAVVDAVFGIIGIMGPIGAGVSMTYFLGKYAYENISGQTLFSKPE